MRFPTFLKLGLALVLLPATAMAGTVSISNTNKSAEKRWTAERYAAARPLPMQQVDAGVDPFPAALAAESSLESRSAAGRAPVAGVRADPSNRLFEPLDRELAALSAIVDEDPDAMAEPASGSGGGYFTSARLVPVSADRSYPYTTVGKLFFTIPGKGDFYCSAAVIRNRIIATAAQCVHSGTPAPGFYTDFEFVPAYRDGAAPFGTWEWEYVAVPSTWTSSKGKLPNAADYGLIEVEDLVFDGSLRRIGDVVGFLGFATQRLRPNHAHLLAYTSSFDGGEKLHQVTAKDAKTQSPSNVLYGSDMRGGSAGGPLIQDFGDSAVLVKWVGALSTLNSSAAVKLQGASNPDSKFMSVLNSVCAHRAGNC